ncbi:hypothetical protein Hanom_Chr09g00814151 [Helianthus anomalus]
MYDFKEESLEALNISAGISVPGAAIRSTRNSLKVREDLYLEAGKVYNKFITYRHNNHAFMQYNTITNSFSYCVEC